MWLEMLDGDMVNIGEAMFVRVEVVEAAAEDQHALWTWDAVNAYFADGSGWDSPFTLYEGERGKCKAFYHWLQCQIQRGDTFIRETFTSMEDTGYVPYLMRTIQEVQEDPEDFVPVEDLWQLIGFTKRNVFDYSLEGLVVGRHLESTPERDAYRVPLNQIGRTLWRTGDVLPLG